jgi:feruloyl-CoA synthase
MNLKETPFLKIKVSKIDIRQKQGKDGVVYLKSTVRLKKRPHRMTERLRFWAEKTPNRVFLAQKKAQITEGGDFELKIKNSELKMGQTIVGVTQSRADNEVWETITYAEAYKKVQSLAHFLLQTDVSPEKPIAILSENSIEHGLMALAALHIGVPYSPIATAYSTKSADFAKLKHVIDTLTPALIFVQNGKAYQKAIEVVAPNIPVVAVDDPLSNHTPFNDILRQSPPLGDLGGNVQRAFEAITPDTLAKILFTSGSTGLPKGVMASHGNVTTNWQQITQNFPFMENGGLTFIDWLPWNHVFGGNHNFGLTLFNGGSLYIDEGNPTQKGIHKTVENLRLIAPTMYCNVPKGFEELIPFLKNDKDLAKHFFSQLKLFFYAGAGMPQHVWDALEQLAYDTTGKRILISTGLGMTEASPSCMFNLEFDSFSGMLGTPVAGLEMKLIPDGGKIEVRFKGGNLTKGYWRNPEATAKAFDNEGFYKTGDALKFVDPTDPNKGFIFDGRIAEDFKLDTGTWVSVGVLKTKFIAAGKGLIQDVVITGHDRAFLGAIVFPELNFCRKIANLDDNATLKEIVEHPSVKMALQDVVNEFAKTATGSSTLIKKVVFADFHLSIDKGEITDKGSINQRQILANYAEVVNQIYAV